jgi:signal transduction histidine kinase
VLVVRRQSEPGYVIYSGAASGAREMSEDSARTLLRFEENASVLYSKRRLGGAARCTGVGLDGKQERLPARQSADCAAVAGLLEARHFAAIPYGQSDGTCGHLFLTSRRRAFTPEDADFLLQFNAAVAKVVENLQLVDELISTAAEHERTAISRDIHDAAVQPYIGLRLALEALYRQSGASGLAPRILDLIDMANSTVRDLRGYTRGLLARGEIPGGSLRTAILMQADRHSRFHGLHISTYVDAESGELSGRFAAQLFFIVVEALSNVVKHTAARRAFVQVTSDANRVSICIGNECSPRVDQAVDFVPKSIKSRVETLGGSLEVHHNEHGYTVVHATLPAQ